MKKHRNARLLPVSSRSSCLGEMSAYVLSFSVH